MGKCGVIFERKLTRPEVPPEIPPEIPTEMPMEMPPGKLPERRLKVPSEVPPEVPPEVPSELPLEVLPKLSSKIQELRIQKKQISPILVNQLSTVLQNLVWPQNLMDFRPQLEILLVTP